MGSQKIQKEKFSWMKIALLEEILLQLPMPVAWACNAPEENVRYVYRRSHQGNSWGEGGGGGGGALKLPASRHRLTLYFTLCNAAKAASKTSGEVRSDVL